MPGKLQDKVSIVTGGSSGIGRGIASLFGQEGSKVVVADMDSQGGEETVSAIKAAGGEAMFISVDVARSQQVEKMIEDTMDTFGKLDILANVAGRQVAAPPLVDVTEDEWDLVMDINIKGTFLCCKYAIPAMLRGGGGSIINVASSVVLKGSTFSLPYSVSKAGVVQLTKTASNQYCSQGIRVNCIVPGLIDSPGSQRVEGAMGVFDQMVAEIPVGRVGNPEDIAHLMVYMASDESAYVSGSSFLIDGGRDTSH